jgi:hypothetical protein
MMGGEEVRPKFRSMDRYHAVGQLRPAIAVG